jgi:hypothetical protein
MEVPQGNAQASYLTQSKISFFVFFFFYYTKLENRRAEQVLPGGVGTSGRGRRWGKG